MSMTSKPWKPTIQPQQDYAPIFAAHLRLLLEEMEPTDVLVVNAMGNLAILREGTYKGYVDFRVSAVKWNADAGGVSSEDVDD